MKDEGETVQKRNGLALMTSQGRLDQYLSEIVSERARRANEDLTGSSSNDGGFLVVGSSRDPLSSSTQHQQQHTIRPSRLKQEDNDHTGSTHSMGEESLIIAQHHQDEIPGKHRLPEGASPPGAYAGAPGLQYNRIASMRIGRIFQFQNFSNTSTGRRGLLPATGPRMFTSNSRLPATQGDVSDENDGKEEASDELYPNNKALCTKRKAVLMGILTILIGVAIVVSIVLTIGETPSSSEYNTPSTTNATKTPETIDVNKFLPNLPERTIQALRDPSSSQSRAHQWLIEDPRLDSYEEWRKYQRFALVSFYYSMGGTRWSSGTHPQRAQFWLNYTSHECEWTPSIACEGEHVVGLNVTRLSGFQGTMPPEVKFLSSLKSFDFSNNILRSTLDALLPLQPFFLPPSLERIHCSNCRLEGSIPSYIGLLTDLNRLSINNNELSGSLPSEVEHLTALQMLDVAGNALTGSIPSTIGNMKSLKEVSMYDNGLSGSIPSQVAALTNIKELRLDFNLLSMTLPTELGLLTRVSCFVNI